MEIRGVTNRGSETALKAARNILADVCPWASAADRDRALECTAQRVRVNPGLWQEAQRMLEDGRSVIAVKPTSAMQNRIDQIQERETVRMRLAEDPGNEVLNETLAVLDATIDPLGARLRELPVERPGRSSHERDFSQHDPHRYAEPAHIYREPRPAAPRTMPAIGDIQLDVGPDYKSVALQQLPSRTVKGDKKIVWKKGECKEMPLETGKEIVLAVESGRMAPRVACDAIERVKAAALAKKERTERNQRAATKAASERAAALPRAPGHRARMKDLPSVLSGDPVVHVSLGTVAELKVMTSTKQVCVVTTASAYGDIAADTDFKLAAAVRDGLFPKSNGSLYSRNEKDSVHLCALSKRIQDPANLVIAVDSAATAMTHGKYLKVRALHKALKCSVVVYDYGAQDILDAGGLEEWMDAQQAINGRKSRKRDTQGGPTKQEETGPTAADAQRQCGDPYFKNRKAKVGKPGYYSGVYTV
jgi:hypothetical protein